MSGPEFKDYFSDHPAGYAAYRPRYPARLFEWLQSEAPDHARVWDAGAGSGQAAVDLAEYFESVIATDASPAQIANAMQHPRVTYKVAPAEESGLPPCSCDLVTAAQALHWFVIPAFFAEARRVLSPGGLLAVWAYADPRLTDKKLNERLQAFESRVHAWWPPERAIVETGYRSVAFPFEEVESPDFDMELDMSLDTLCGYLRSWSSTKRYVAATGEDPVTDLRAELEPLWPEGKRRIEWTLHVRAGRKGRDEVLQ